MKLVVKSTDYIFVALFFNSRKKKSSNFYSVVGGLISAASERTFISLHIYK